MKVRFLNTSKKDTSNLEILALLSAPLLRRGRDGDLCRAVSLWPRQWPVGDLRRRRRRRRGEDGGGAGKALCSNRLLLLLLLLFLSHGQSPGHDLIHRSAYRSVNENTFFLFF